MKPGSLVMFCPSSTNYLRTPKMLGIIIREAKEYAKFVGSPHRWWEVWSDNKIIIDMEECIKLVE